MPKLIYTLFKETQDSCSLKNGCNVCHIHGIPGIFMYKNSHLTLISVKHRRVVSKCMFRISLLYEIYRENSILLIVAWKKKLVKFWKINEWYLYGYCLEFSKEKWGGGGGAVETLKRVYFKLWIFVKWKEVWFEMFQNLKSNALFPWSKLINFNCKHNILHQF